MTTKYQIRYSSAIYSHALYGVYNTREEALVEAGLFALRCHANGESRMASTIEVSSV